jgi:hypothetical protein
VGPQTYIRTFRSSIGRNSSLRRVSVFQSFKDIERVIL